MILPVQYWHGEIYGEIIMHMNQNMSLINKGTHLLIDDICQYDSQESVLEERCPSSKCPSLGVSHQSVPEERWPSSKCPSREVSLIKVSLKRGGPHQSVPEERWPSTKCPLIKVSLIRCPSSKCPSKRGVPHQSVPEERCPSSKCPWREVSLIKVSLEDQMYCQQHEFVLVYLIWHSSARHSFTFSYLMWQLSRYPPIQGSSRYHHNTSHSLQVSCKEHQSHRKGQTHWVSCDPRNCCTLQVFIARSQR